MFSSVRTQFIRLWLGIFVSLILSFASLMVGALNVSAIGMDHAMSANQSCFTGCNTTTYTPAMLASQQEEDDLPTPPITTPYFVQFQKITFTQTTPPQDIILSSSYRPPDINRLESRFRF